MANKQSCNDPWDNDRGNDNYQISNNGPIFPFTLHQLHAADMNKNEILDHTDAYTNNNEILNHTDADTNKNEILDHTDAALNGHDAILQYVAIIQFIYDTLPQYISDNSNIINESIKPKSIYEKTKNHLKNLGFRIFSGKQVD